MNAASLVLLQRRLGPLLAPLGAAYAALMRGRAALHGSGLLDHFEPDAPAISVGNIAWGGSGKTPVCRWLLDWAFAHGWRTALLTRGYGARPPSLPFEVRLNSPADFAGDEPLYLKRGRPEATVLVDPKRVRSGAWARERVKPDLYVYDDAFQHLPARRHVNLVLLRPADLTDEWNRVLPSGSWREGASALARASAFLVKTEPERTADLRDAVRRRLGGLGKPVFSFHLAARGLTRLDGTPAPLPDESYLLASGVADPAGVAVTAERLLGRPPVRRLDYPDHHPFSAADAASIARDADRLGAAVVCTPKDAVKLRRHAEAASFLVFDLDLAFGPVLLLPTGAPPLAPDAPAPPHAANDDMPRSRLHSRPRFIPPNAGSRGLSPLAGESREGEEPSLAAGGLAPKAPPEAAPAASDRSDFPAWLESAVAQAKKALGPA